MPISTELLISITPFIPQRSCRAGNGRPARDNGAGERGPKVLGGTVTYLILHRLYSAPQF